MTENPVVSLQTFTIRRYLKSRNETELALKRVRSLGLNALELARIRFTPDVIDHISGICRDEGIRVMSTQMKLKEIENDLSWTVELHRRLGCSLCSVSVVDLAALRTEAGVIEYAGHLNGIGRRLRNEGLRLLFHHHNFEFTPAGEALPFNLLLERLDPESVGLVLDTYWLQRSGCSPEAMIHSLKGRVVGVHLRDFRLKPPVWMPRITDCELGRGNIDFRRVCEAAAETGCSYMAIEQASEDPWRSIETSVKHLTDIGVL